MGLWIRSQDRERLTLTGDLRIDYCVENGMYGIDSCDYIGFYKTKERALEVLDEIQIEISAYVGTMAQIIYEMPKE